MTIPTFIKSYPASADIAPKRIVAFSDAANSPKVATAAASTDKLVGVSDASGGKNGGMVDVIRAGLGEVQLGGTVAAGDKLTADENGKAVLCEPAAGETREYIGTADAPGVANDIIPVFLAPGVMHEPETE